MPYIVAQAGSASVYNLQSLIPVWLTLHIAGGQIGLPLAVLTFIFAPKSAGRPRYITLINFCVTWIIYSLVYCILLYSGQADKNQESPTRLCLAQAALIHGAPPMCAVAGLEMVLQLWFVQKRINRTDFPYIRNLSSHFVDILIIIPPYIAFLGFSLLAMGHGILEENMILSLNHIYCSSQSYRFSLIVPIFCAVVMAGIIMVEAIIWYNWYKARKEVDDLLEVNQSDSLAGVTREYQHRRLSASISIRVGIFTLYSITTLSACLVFVSNMPISFPYMVEACLPIAAFLLFGTQRDIVDFWFCRKRRLRSRSMSSVEKGIPSARSPSTFPSIESILTPSILTISTAMAPNLSRETTRSDEAQLESTKNSEAASLCRTSRSSCILVFL